MDDEEICEYVIEKMINLDFKSEYEAVQTEFDGVKNHKVSCMEDMEVESISNIFSECWSG